MTRLITSAALAVALAAPLAGCGPSGDDPNYREPADSARASPNATPTLDAKPDSTAGVARSSGQPGVAGEKVSRSSDISAPTGKAP